MVKFDGEIRGGLDLFKDEVMVDYLIINFETLEKRHSGDRGVEEGPTNIILVSRLRKAVPWL